LQIIKLNKNPRQANQCCRNLEVLLSSSTQQAHKTDASSAIWQVWQRDILKVDSQRLRINVVAILKSSCPPQLNKLTPRMRRLYGRFGNETQQRLSGTPQEQTASVQQ
jgi:hypothetical protein